MCLFGLCKWQWLRLRDRNFRFLKSKLCESRATSIGLEAPFCASLPRFLDSSVDRAQRIMGSAALVVGSILVATAVRFASIRMRVTWDEQSGS